MDRPRANRKPSFRAQATLIVLPVVILASVGAWSLRQDRLLAEQEARDRARQLAELLLPELADALALMHTDAVRSAEAQASTRLETPEVVSFRISSDGRLLEPEPLADPVPAPLDPTRLEPALARLWETARDAHFRDRAADAALTAYGQFLAGDPPDDFAAVAELGVAMLESQQGRQLQARDRLLAVIGKHPETRLETGLPAQSVAMLKFIELAGSDPAGADLAWGELLEGVCSNAVWHPTWVSRPLLDAAVSLSSALDLPQVGSWEALWKRHEAARRLFTDARHHLPFSAPLTRMGNNSSREESTAELAAHRTQDGPEPAGPVAPLPFWFASGGRAWLALWRPNARSDRWIDCLPEGEVAREIDAVLANTRNVPGYFGLGVTLALRQYRFGPPPNSAAGQWRPAIAAVTEIAAPPSRLPNGGAIDPEPVAGESVELASSSVAHPVLGELGLRIFLDAPSVLFARQRARTFWFGALIVASAVAALIGLVTAWRAFHRQQLLADLQSRFVSSVSHELRAPIGSIRLLAEGLESGRIRAPEKQAEYFGLMGQECGRLTALIENVLDFSRIDQGRKQYELEPTDIVSLVQQTVRLMEPQAAHRQVTLSLSLPLHFHLPSPIADICPPSSDLHPAPSLDGRAIQQALVNLIDNAIKHAIARCRPCQQQGGRPVPAEPGCPSERPKQTWTNTTRSGDLDHALRGGARSRVGRGIRPARDAGSIGCRPALR
jgi:hypothetical protein